MWLSCPASWKFKYVDKIQTIATPALTFGSAIHTAVEQYLVREDKNLKPTDFWSPAWAAALEKQPTNWGEDTPEQHFNEGVRILSNEQIIYNLNTLTAVKIEEMITLRVPGVPIPIIGYIDIQTQDGVPGDFKTSARSWTADKAQAETQSLFYLAALNQDGRTVDGWRFRHYIIVKTKTPQWQMFEHTHKPAEVFWLFGMIQKVWLGISAGVFPESPVSWKCSEVFCDYWKICRGKYLK
jgi:hypothetical protein